MSSDIYYLIIIIMVGVILANVVAKKNYQGVLAVFNGVACMMATTVNTLLGQPTQSNQFCDALKKGG